MIKDAPPFVEICHCTVGVGAPVKATVNEAFEPAHTDVFCGFEVIDVAVFTVIVAAVVLTLPQKFVNTARYCWVVCVKDGDVE